MSGCRPGRAGHLRRPEGPSPWTDGPGKTERSTWKRRQHLPVLGWGTIWGRMWGPHSVSPPPSLGASFSSGLSPPGPVGTAPSCTCFQTLFRVHAGEERSILCVPYRSESPLGLYEPRWPSGALLCSRELETHELGHAVSHGPQRLPPQLCAGQAPRQFSGSDVVLRPEGIQKKRFVDTEQM